MWKKLYDLAKLVFTFGQQTQKNQDNIEVLQEEVRQLAVALQRMAYELQRVRDELQHLRESESHEREKLVLRLENERLKFERRLPAAKRDAESLDAE